MSVSDAAAEQAAAAEPAAAETQEQEGKQEAAPNNELEQRMNEQMKAWGERVDRIETALKDEPDGEEQRQQAEQTMPGRVLMDPESGIMYDTFTGQPVEDQYAGQDYSPEQIQQLVEQRATEIAQQQVAPLNEYVRGQQYAGLEETYPAMREKATADAVVAEARQLAQRIGSPDAWQHPEFLEQVYIAQDARKRAEDQEDPATGQRTSPLEDPSAVPSGREQEEGDAIGDAIVGAGGNSEARRYFGG